MAEARDAGQGSPVDDRVDRAPPDGLARTAYRVVQEGLTNARRHAPGAPVSVVLSGQSGGGLRSRCATPRPGGSARAGGPGLGLTGLTERVELAGGGLQAGPTAGEFRLRVSLPWPA